MLKLISLLRAAQLYIHHAHLMCKGALFSQDHTHLADLYSAYEDGFDRVSERLIGLEKESEIPLNVVMALMFEMKIQEECKKICKMEGTSEGTKQLIGEEANQSEARCYKIKQRIK